MKRIIASQNTVLLVSILGVVLLVGFRILPCVEAAEPSTVGYPRLMQGPMLGAVSHDGFKIWTRASGEYSVSVEWGTAFDLRSSVETEAVPAKASDSPWCHNTARAPLGLNRSRASRSRRTTNRPIYGYHDGCTSARKTTVLFST